MLRIVARTARYSYGFGHLGMNKVPVATFAAAINKTGSLELDYEFSYLWRHGKVAYTSVA